MREDAARRWAKDIWRRQNSGTLDEQHAAELWSAITPAAREDLRQEVVVALDSMEFDDDFPDCEYDFFSWLACWLTPDEELGESGNLVGRIMDAFDPFRHEKSSCECSYCETIRKHFSRIGRTLRQTTTVMPRATGPRRSTAGASVALGGS